MRFSSRTVYGLKAVFLLASRFGQGSLSVSQIAKRENISAAYLEQILGALKRRGFVKSVRGPQGGWVLSKKPAETTLEGLFYALEGRDFFGLNGGQSPAAETDEAAIGNLIFWKRLEASVEKGLADTTLKDLLDEARRLKKGKPGPIYPFHI